jgi:enamine deaminase RidA (YjgF/YER057c/UK114 family)
LNQREHRELHGIPAAEVIVGLLRPGALIEIEAIAAVPKR